MIWNLKKEISCISIYNLLQMYHSSQCYLFPAPEVDNAEDIVEENPSSEPRYNLCPHPHPENSQQGTSKERHYSITRGQFIVEFNTTLTFSASVVHSCGQLPILLSPTSAHVTESLTLHLMTDWIQWKTSWRHWLLWSIVSCHSMEYFFLMMMFSLKLNLVMVQADITAAFLHAELPPREDFYTHQA